MILEPNEITCLEAYDLYVEAYEDKDYQCEDEFLGLMDAIERYDFKLTREQKVKVGKFLCNNREEKLAGFYEKYWDTNKEEREAIINEILKEKEKCHTK